MKLKTVSIVLLSLILGIGCNQLNENRPQSNSSGVPKQTKQTKINHQSKPPASPFDSGGNSFFKNLQIHFINGESPAKDAKYLPLAEAMEKGIARVNETGRVNNLTIENLSETEYVFVNAGDIVKGGKQDRYLANSLIVPPNSGKVPLASFCVEAGRWQQRGRENTAFFSSSKFMASSNDLKLAAQLHYDQGKVWDQVAFSRVMYYRATEGHGISATVATPAGLPSGIPESPNQSAIDPNAGLAIAVRGALPVEGAQLQQAARIWGLSSTAGSTSLQLALENPKVQELVDEYTDYMDRQMAAQKYPIGLAVAINGKVVSADIYGQDDLFKAMWPKLINGAATEAVAKFDKKMKVKRLIQADFESFLANGKQESTVNKTLNDQTRLLTTRGDQHILFETHDKRDSSKWIHRSYLATPKK